MVDTKRTLTIPHISMAINIIEAARGQWKMDSREYATLVEAERLLQYERNQVGLAQKEG